jgi:hypothetical protein
VPSARNKFWLNRIALISGILGALWLIFDTMSAQMMFFSWYAVPGALIYAVPLLACLTIALKWRMTGGILLIIYGLLWPVYYFIFLVTSPYNLPLIYIIRWSIRVSPAYIIPGILFLVSRTVYGINPPQKQPMTPERITGIIIIGIAAIACLISGLLVRTYNDPMARFISRDILSYGGLFLLVFAALARPKPGGIIGAGYAVLMLAFMVINQLKGRTLIMQDLRHQFIPTMLLLAGSLIVLFSSPRQQVTTPATPRNDSTIS